MNKDYQREQLRRMLENPMLKSGIYLIDTDLEDADIERLIKDIDGLLYKKGSLIPSKSGSTFELFVIDLSYYCEGGEILELTKLFMLADRQKKENILYSLLINIMRNLCKEGKTVIHVCGDDDVNSLSHEDLYKLNEALSHHEKTIVIASKKKSVGGMKCDSLIKIFVFKEEKIRLMENRKEKVHISYKHNDAYNNAMKAIKAGLEKNGIPYSIDEYDIMYRDNIDDYEKEIGASYLVIMFVIPAYLKSLDCMFEMTQMFKNGKVKERIFPVVDMGEIKRNGDGLGPIKDYWQAEKVRKSERLAHEPGKSSYLLMELQKIDDIINILDDFWLFICREFSGSYEQMIENDAAFLMEELKKLLDAINVESDEIFAPSEKDEPAPFRNVVQKGDKSVYIENNNGSIIIN